MSHLSSNLTYYSYEWKYPYETLSRNTATIHKREKFIRAQFLRNTEIDIWYFFLAPGESNRQNEGVLCTQRLLGSTIPLWNPQDSCAPTSGWGAGWEVHSRIHPQHSSGYGRDSNQGIKTYGGLQTVTVKSDK